MIFYIFLIIFLLSIISFLILSFIGRRYKRNNYSNKFSSAPCGSGRGDKNFTGKVINFFKIIDGIITFITFIITCINCNAPSIDIYPDISSIGYQDEITIDGFLLPVYYSIKGKSIKEYGQNYQESFFIDNENIIEGKYKIDAAYKIFGFILPFWKAKIEYDVSEASKPVFMNFNYNSESKMSENDLCCNITDGNCHTSAFWTYTDESYIMFSNSLDDLEEISHIYINNGNGMSEESYVECPRPAKIKFEFSDGKEEIHTLDDTIETQIVKFNITHKTSYIKISILNVFPENVSDKFYISDIFFYK